MNDPIHLTVGDLFLCSLFLLLPAWLSWRDRLGVHQDLLIGGLRCCGQLLLAGYLLGFIFESNRWYWVLAMLTVMVLVGGRTAVARQKSPVPGLLRLTTFSIFVSSLLTLGFCTVVVVQVHPWYDARYLIPLAGMVIGNAMNGSSLAAERLASELRLRRDAIQARLALGASPRQAADEAIRATIKAALIPTINGMMSVGLVHLPGMMTGQMLGGASPMTAVRYQILIFYALAFVSAATAILVSSLAYRRYFTPREQLDPARFA